MDEATRTAIPRVPPRLLFPFFLLCSEGSKSWETLSGSKEDPSGHWQLITEGVAFHQTPPVIPGLDRVQSGRAVRQ